ncbi:phenylalanine--tRNA ligase alpha subunit, cytoplasmic-like [Durio zibethinus]|uniref:Phenylalanine--tRNA ligase alpha subunit, cytoplasmic-like n=1 Tax=Durio zibethinus TaxID=66656 RepID=A0A6P5XDN4_DURZI|nr:phenylalanine--tRNA ligase alpha subunit, cytoplasmic-like [Durio zibethinus]
MHASSFLNSRVPSSILKIMFLEKCFWNFDALFHPQQHPARDSHDTFLLEVPSTTWELPEDYVELVKHVHESGGYGSRGYMYDWKREEANKNLLRTHTTAVSTRMLYALAKECQRCVSSLLATHILNLAWRYSVIIKA